LRLDAHRNRIASHAPYALGLDNRRALDTPRNALPGASRIALNDASDVDCRRKLSILLARTKHSNRQSPTANECMHE
jgi:hypothetical protein